jgi:hypothetical protein
MKLEAMCDIRTERLAEFLLANPKEAANLLSLMAQFAKSEFFDGLGQHVALWAPPVEHKGLIAFAKNLREALS